MKSDHMILDDADRLMSTVEVGQRLGTGTDIARRLIDAGLLPALTFGRNRRIRKIQFGKFLEKYEGQDIFQVLKEAEKHAAG